MIHAFTYWRDFRREKTQFLLLWKHHVTVTRADNKIVDRSQIQMFCPDEINCCVEGP